TQFGGEFWHRYLHLESVKQEIVLGGFVRQGTQLGRVGDKSGGMTFTNAHLHFDLLGDVLTVNRYISLYGAPTDGIPQKTLYGRPIPAEPFIPAPYTRNSRDRAVKRNIPVLGPARASV
ncbi:unnamed protein product, partial [marine sediment metagenome]